nr:MAG TPA: hypothetical protein [Caudoviricetes sp.]
MKVTKEINDFNTLYRNSWSGAIQTLDVVIDYHKENELMALLEELFDEHITGEPVSETTINDYLWFEYDEIMECLGISEDSEDDE